MLYFGALEFEPAIRSLMDHPVFSFLFPVFYLYCILMHLNHPSDLKWSMLCSIAKQEYRPCKNTF